MQHVGTEPFDRARLDQVLHRLPALGLGDRLDAQAELARALEQRLVQALDVAPDAAAGWAGPPERAEVLGYDEVGHRWRVAWQP